MVLMPGAVIGMARGWLFASCVSDEERYSDLSPSLLLVFIAQRLAAPGACGAEHSTVSGGLVPGAVSGSTSFASQGGGPPFQVYTLPQQLPKLVFVGTTTVFFAAVNVMKIVPYSCSRSFQQKISPPLSFSCPSRCWPISQAFRWRKLPTAQFTRSPMFSSSFSIRPALAGRKRHVDRSEQKRFLICINAPRWHTKYFSNGRNAREDGAGYP